MSRYRKPLEVIDVDNDDEMPIESQTPKKLDFTSTRKKGQISKKRGIFTPLKLPGEVEPKSEPESPTVASKAPVVKTKRATNAKGPIVQPKLELEPQEEVSEASLGMRVESRSLDAAADSLPARDVKPDIGALEHLLGGLVLERPDPSTANAQDLNMNTSLPPSPMRHAPSASASRSPEPLFMPYDSPGSSPFSASLELSPQSDTSLVRNSPRLQAPVHVIPSTPSAPTSTTTALLDLFASDSPPPPPRQLQSPSASSSSSRAGNHVTYTDSETESPIAGPSKSRIHANERQAKTRHDQSPTSSESPCRSSVTSAAHLTDIKPDLASLQLSEDTNPEISLSTTTPSSKPRRRAFLEFLDTVAKDDESEDEYEYHLDESEGSLKDFIVDDNEVSFISDSEGSIGGLESEEEDSDVVEVKVDRSAYLDDSDNDSDIVIEEAVSHPKIGRVSALDFLDFTESDNEILNAESDADDFLDAVNDLNITEKTAGKGKAKAKKVDKAPKWAIERVRIAQDVFDDLDKRVFDGKLGPDRAGAKIIWNKRLLTTAGTAQRRRRRQPGGETSWDVAIQLSEKVCTGEEQVLSTVAHEMCHLACWVIDREFKNPHGKIFKSWGRKVMRKRNDLEVTTKHDYVIEYKYHWRCIDCKKVYKRHSKSIDIEKQGCGICKGKLEPLFETKSRGTSTFQVYLKQNMKTAKAALPGASHGDVMRALSARWTEAGAEADHEAHWRAVLTASTS